MLSVRTPFVQDGSPWPLHRGPPRAPPGGRLGQAASGTASEQGYQPRAWGNLPAASARRPPRLWRCSAPAQDRFHRLQEPSATACPPTRGEAARRVSSSPHSRTRGTRRVTLLGGATAAVYLPQARCCGAGRTWAGACRGSGNGAVPAFHSAQAPPQTPGAAAEGEGGGQRAGVVPLKARGAVQPAPGAAASSRERGGA